MKRWLQKVSKSVKKFGDRRVSSGKLPSWRLSFGKGRDGDGDGVAGSSVLRDVGVDGTQRDSVVRRMSTFMARAAVTPSLTIVRDFAMPPLAAVRDTFLNPRTPPPQPPSPSTSASTSASPALPSTKEMNTAEDTFAYPQSSSEPRSSVSPAERGGRDAAAEYLRKRSRAAETFRSEEGGMLSPMEGSSPICSDDEEVEEGEER